MTLAEIIDLVKPEAQQQTEAYLQKSFNSITHRKEYINKNSLCVEFRDGALGEMSQEQVRLTEHVREYSNPTLIYQDLAKASQAIAIALHQKQVQDMRFLAVTGTNGKSTVVEFCRQLLEIVDPQLKASSLGTLGLQVGDKFLPAANTTPFPLDLYRHITDAHALDSRLLILEASSHGLDQGRLQGLQFSVAGYTNLTQDHLDYHENLKAYLAAKAKLNKQTAGCFVINKDCEKISTVQSEQLMRIEFSTQNSDADFFAKNVTYDEKGCLGSLCHNSSEVDFQLQVFGEHNVSNLLCAISMLKQLGYSFEALVQASKQCHAPKGRLDVVKRSGKGTVIIDYAHTHDALEHALQCLRIHYPNAKLKVLVGCGGDRDRGKRPLMAQAACRLADDAIFTSDNPRSENPEQILNDMCQGLSDDASYTRITNREEAIQQSVKNLNEGEVLLLAGKGHEDYQEIKGAKLPFDEYQICKEVS